MQITISLLGLGYFILFVLLAVFLVYAIIVLAKLAQVLKRTDEVLATVPAIMKNVEQATDHVLHGVETADQAVEIIAGSLVDTADTIRSGTSQAAGYLGVITQVVNLIKALFFKK